MTRGHLNDTAISTTLTDVTSKKLGFSPAKQVKDALAG
jgi:hypothetical protein